MKAFTLQSAFRPTENQRQAIENLVRHIQSGEKEQVLLGVTGSGKTFTMANVIAQLRRPTLIISHNKTLAAQLYQEFRAFFPNNAVSYFVSYYDYYQPEAYVPQTNTYIEKETEINEELDTLRLAATRNVLSRRDTIIVASVSCIYNIGSPRQYVHFVIEAKRGMREERQSIVDRLVDLQYKRDDYGFARGTFRIRGESLDLFPAYDDSGIRFVLSNGFIHSIERIDTLTGRIQERLEEIMIYPAKHYMTDPATYRDVFRQVRSDLEERTSYFMKQGKLLEAQRIRERVNYDLEMIQEVGYVSGIENYSRYFDGRRPGEPPYTLFDYFEEAARANWLLIIDESHMSLPQIRGMWSGDRSRKQTLVDFGFRLPAALDNRPLTFDEFLRSIPQTIYVSATPADWERSRGPVTEQLLRPTGLVDPQVEIRRTKGQIADLLKKITHRVARHERVLVTTVTKRMAEDVAEYLREQGINVHYLHADIETIKRSDILADLRKGTYDVLVGVNLLREGLDLPEVSMVAVLDADKEGFLRSRVSLIQTMGRAARHVRGHVILYADSVTEAIREATAEVDRRRAAQISYNTLHHISPKSIGKPFRERLVEVTPEASPSPDAPLLENMIESLTPYDKKRKLRELVKNMHRASRDMNFERAARIRDLIRLLETSR